MYFASRLQAGRMLATKLIPKYRHANCTVVALNDGGVMVGAQIAVELHCALTMLVSEEIYLPREPSAIGGITSDGNFAYNPEYSNSEIDEFSGEYRSFIEEQKISKIHEMNKLLGQGGLISRSLLNGHHVILVADGMRTGFMLDMAMRFLKPVAITKLIVAVPIASVKVIDQIHVTADDIYCLDVPNEYLFTDHYYDKLDVPDHKTITETIQKMVSKWQ